MRIQFGSLISRVFAVFFLIIFIMALTASLPADEIKDEEDKNLQMKAEKRDADEQSHLGEKFRFEPYETDSNQTLDRMKKAADQGIVIAQFALGMMYEEAREVPQDYKQAIYWYTKAAEQGFAKAQHKLALIYKFGQGVQQDYKQAIYWCKKAAEQGFANAQFLLAEMYDEGEGLPQDYKQALFWYTKAAEQGHVYSQYNLGIRYYIGEKTPQNYLYSYIWHSLAAAQGFVHAQKRRDDIVKLLTLEQLAQAQKIAAEVQYKIENPEKASAVPQALTDKNLTTHQPKITCSGTGFLITKDGYLFTCFHVIENADIIKIAVGRDLYPANLIRADANCDLALLKIDGTFNALAFSLKRTAGLGEDVFTMGFPMPELQGVNPKLTKGSINSLTGIKDDLRFYQISVPVQPGNSGGPLLDVSGNICGIIVSMLDAETVFEISGSLPQNVNYAVKSTYAQALLDTLPEVLKNLPAPTMNASFEAVAEKVEKSIVLVLAYK